MTQTQTHAQHTSRDTHAHHTHIYKERQAGTQQHTYTTYTLHRHIEIQKMCRHTDRHGQTAYMTDRHTHRHTHQRNKQDTHGHIHTHAQHTSRDTQAIIDTHTHNT